MATNARVIVRQIGDPVLNLKYALQRLRKYASPVMQKLRQKEYFVSEARQRRHAARKAAFDRRLG